MKKKLLSIVTLLFLSVGCVHLIFSTLLAGDINELLPLKISPQIPTEHGPQQRNKYSPQELRRIYMFEHIHKSVERGKKGIAV